MSRSADIYNYGRILEVLNKIKNSTTDKESKDKILESLHNYLAEGISKPRIIKYATTLEQIAKLLGKSFSKVSKEDP